jgi:hypothetical protein
MIIILGKVRVWRTGHELIEFTPELRKSISYERPLPQDLSETRRGKEVSAFFSHLNRRGGALFWGGGVHRDGKQRTFSHYI